MDRLDKYEGGADVSQRTMRFFTFWVLVAQGLGLSAVVLVGVWMGSFRGGFAWTEEPSREFNYHPLFMTIGMIFLYGDAILVYRVFRNDRKAYVKVLHAILHVFALVFSIVGLKAVFDSHNLVEPPVGNMYSLHSWMGLGVIILFGLQWVVGFLCFLYPAARMDLRAAFKPVHVFWGLAIFLGAIATALMGITEKMIFVSRGSDQITSERALSNIFGVVIVLLGIVVTYIVTNEKYARQPTPEEEHIQLSE